MGWIKKGRIFEPEKDAYWNKSHAQEPVVDCVNDEIWRIYYNTRDEQNRTRCSYIEVEAGKPDNITYICKAPILELGPLGAFDDCGTMCTSILTVNGIKYLYYIGWNVRNTISYHLSLGVATSADGINFKKCFEGPILDRNYLEGYMCASCYVLHEENDWKMWYTSGTGHKIIGGRNEPFYKIKYATSVDGILWNRENITSIEYKNDHEALGVPTVLYENDRYKMWYSYRDVSAYRESRGNSYRIGYAESDDGKTFKRMDEKAEIDISLEKEAWDSEMIAYGKVIKHNGKKYMFYNGNGFGQSGIGYAMWED